MLVQEQAVPSHAEAPAPALTRSAKSGGSPLQPIAVDHLAQVKTKRKAANPASGAVGSTPIPSTPEFAGMSAAEVMVALEPVFAIADKPRRRCDTPEHHRALMEAAWRITLACEKTPGKGLSDAQSDRFGAAKDALERRLMRSPVTDRAAARCKREIVQGWYREDCSETDAEPVAILAFVDQLIAAAFPPIKGDDEKLANLLHRIQQNSAAGETYDRNGLTPSGRHVDDLSTEQVNLMIEMAAVPAQSMAGVAAKVEALVTASRGNIPMLRDDVGGNGPSDDITVSILRDIFAINPRADLPSLRSVSVSTGEPFLDFFRAFARDVLELAGKQEG